MKYEKGQVLIVKHNWQRRFKTGDKVVILDTLESSNINYYLINNGWYVENFITMVFRKENIFEWLKRKLNRT